MSLNNVDYRYHIYLEFKKNYKKLFDKKKIIYQNTNILSSSLKK